MSRSKGSSRRWVAGATAVALAVAGGIALTPSASGAPGLEAKKKPTPRNAYIYGNWSQPGSGFMVNNDDTASEVYQLTWRGAYPDLDDTPGPIYAAGSFVQSGANTIRRVGMFDDTTQSWVKLPGDDTGIQPNVGVGGVTANAPSPGVYGMVLGGDDSLYVGGIFSQSDDSLNNVAQWNGSDWVRMGWGLYSAAGTTPVQDVVIGNDFIGGDDTNYADDTIYAMGSFEGPCNSLTNCTNDAFAADKIAQYSQRDDTWYSMGGSGTTTGTPFAGAYIDDTLYVGGNFTQLAGASFGKVAQWRESDDAWISLGRGLVDGDVFAMAVHPITKDLYVGGTFDQPEGYPADSMLGIAKWDYTDDTWYAVGTGLTNPNVDDISFSPDGKTMWIGNWDGSPTVSGTTAHQVAVLVSEDLDDTAATTVNGAWNLLKSPSAFGIEGGTSAGSLNQKSVRAALALDNQRVMFGGNFNKTLNVSAGRVAVYTPGPEPSPYDPVYPPGVPTDVVATSGWNTVTVEWKAPTYTGSYPITNYLVTSTPGNRVCITTLADAKLTECTFTSLTPGTRYTFRVQGLNGGGWGDRSEFSNVATPQNLKITSHNRRKLNFFLGGGSEVTAAGIAPGFAPGTRIVPWVKIGDRAWESAATSGLTLSSVERFSWKRKFNKKQNSTPISVRFEIGGNFSNTVLLRPVR